MVTGGLPQLTSEHPVLRKALAGGLMVLIGRALFTSVGLSLGVGVPFSVVNWLL